MKSVLSLCLVLLGAVTVPAAPPSDQSINELLNVMNVKRMLEQISANMEEGTKAGMQQGLQQSLPGRQLTPEQKGEFDKFQQKLIGMMRDELAFEKAKDIYMKAYRETLTQDEVDALLTFYKSPAGKTYLEKVPLAMQRAGNEMQSRIGPAAQKATAMQEQFFKDLAAKSH